MCKCETKTIMFTIPALMGKPRVSVPNILVVRKCEECENEELATMVFRYNQSLIKQIAISPAPRGVVNYIWITINPKPEVTLKKFISKIKQIIKYKWVLSYWYSLEQRGEDNEKRGEGMHCHMLLKIPTGKRIPDIRAQLTKVLISSIIGTKKHVHFVTPREIKLSPDQFMEDKLEYLEGHKWDSEKDVKIEQDLIWREENNLENIYKTCHIEEDIQSQEGNEEEEYGEKQEGQPGEQLNLEQKPLQDLCSQN